MTVSLERLIPSLPTPIDQQRVIVRRADGLHLETRKLAPPGAGEALVKIEAAALCRTDLAAAEGAIHVDAGRVLGHEAAGVVLATGPDKPIAVNTRVAINPLTTCATCRACRAGEAQNCLRPRFLGLDRDGCFADYVVLPAAQLVACPGAGDPLRRAYFEPLAAALGVFDAPLQRDSRILLVGRNRIIGLTNTLLQRAGYRNLECRAAPDLAGLPTNRFDIAVESGLDADLAAQLVRVLRPGGCLVLKTRHNAPVAVDVAAVVAKSLTLKACRYGSFARAAELTADLSFPLEPLLGPAFSLQRFESAFAAASGGEKRKVFIDPTLPE
ncbi:alcohol dehydrogenase catalytic domain-containing protein [Acanthopleuribacter pedis]|uniref:Alcohol dehydrogenase catalytic domain-containing protein n=1 Tax=Acanthopleuribacter pedis TaxID=442870 RepID=A0A8J7QC74_9BACT|nr:alcohol dehydrogenase catalytic domain-containing protein [Acanthopleuribacter pedis]MBO1322996.1 alcohol dehydrogenase catalytic domain-containing protein [Acanthopleuribacter pedis]